VKNKLNYNLATILTRQFPTSLLMAHPLRSKSCATFPLRIKRERRLESWEC